MRSKKEVQRTLRPVFAKLLQVIQVNPQLSARLLELLAALLQRGILFVVLRPDDDDLVARSSSDTSGSSAGSPPRGREPPVPPSLLWRLSRRRTARHDCLLLAGDRPDLTFPSRGVAVDEGLGLSH